MTRWATPAMAADVLAGDAMAGDVLASDILASDALASDALASDALAADAITADLRAVGPDDALRSDAEPELRLAAFLYEQLFDHPATLVMSAPGALTIFGLPGDRHALAIPVRWGASVAAARRDDGMICLRSGSHAGKELTRPIDAVDDPPTWAARPLAVVASVRRAGDRMGGMSLLVGTVLPDGIGMQSDIALTTVVASALARLFGTGLSLEQRAGLGDVPAQLASLSCPAATAVLVDTRSMTVEQVPFDLVGAGLRLMMIDLGVEVGGVPTGAPDLARAAAEELRSGNAAGLGDLLDRTIDLAADPDGAGAVVAGAARAAGALGLGTLGGGCLAALVPVSRLSEVRSAVSAAWPGDRAPKFLTAVSSRGGRPLAVSRD
jgi:galactokinase